LNGSSELGIAGALLVGIITIATLVNTFARDHRWVVRRLVILYGLFVVILGLAVALDRLGLLTWSLRLRLGAHILAAFTVINMAGAIVFELSLPKLGFRPAKIVSDLTLGAAYFVAAGAVLASSGFSLTSVITTGAVFSAVLALSLQTTLGNVLGGVALQLDGTVKVGDWIQTDNGRQGVVREIRWRCTIVETRDCDTIILPNAQLLSTTLLVLGRRDGKPVPRRMRHLFYVDFRFTPSRVVQAVTDALLASPLSNVAVTPPPSVVCLALGRDAHPSYAVYEVRYFILDFGPDGPTDSAVLTRVYAALRRAGIPLARPVATHFVRMEGEELDARREARHRTRRVEALSAVTIFGALTPDEKSVLEGQLEYVPFTAGEKMTRQGAIAHWLYVMTSGTAEAMRIHEDGEATLLGTLEAPDFFGEMGLMTGEPRIADVIAKTDIECFRLRKEGFQKVLLNRPEIAKELSRRLAERRINLLAAAGDRTKTQVEEEERIFEAIGRFFGLET
jgi:small-conductance mechanosensitive channel/CRP-like cAMP-binding protein